MARWSRLTSLAYVAAAGVLLVGVNLAFAAINMRTPQTPDGQLVTIQTDAWAEYFDPEGSTGTGVFSPYLRTQSSSGIQHGYNSDIYTAGLEYETKTDPHTHSVLLSDIPVVSIDPGTGPVDVYEFIADWNEPNSADEIDLQQFELYCIAPDTIDGTNIGTYGYKYGTNGFDGGDVVDAVWGTPVFQLTMEVLLIDHNTGSGDGDFKLFVDTDSLSGCASTDYVVTWTVWNDVSGGFTEWGFIIQPTVDLSKTLDVTYETDIDWTIDKSVDSPTGEALAGNSVSFDYDIDLTRTDTMVNWAVDGTVSFSGDFDLNGNQTRDILLIDTTTYPSTGTPNPNTFQPTLTCPGGSATTVDGLAAVEVSVGPSDFDVLCTYSGDLPGDFDPEHFDDIFNTVEIRYQVGHGSKASTELFDADAIDEDGPSDEGLAAGSEPESVTISDNNDIDENDFGDVGPYETTDTYSYTNDYACPTDESLYEDGEYSFEVNNTASIDQTDDSDPEKVTVTCYGPTVSKTAEGTKREVHTWDITKTPGGTYDLFAGQSVDHDYTITVYETITYDTYQVTGTVTILNPASEDMDLEVVDALDNGTGVDLTSCDNDAVLDGSYPSQTVTVKPGTTECSYSVTDDEGDATYNSVTVSLGDFDASDDSDPFTYQVGSSTGPESVTVDDDDFDDGLVVDETFGPWDDGEGGTYTGTYTCPDPDDEEYTDGEYTLSVTNRATINETGDDATATVDITCHVLTVTKDAETSYSRDYNWDISKARFIATSETDGDDLPETLTLDEGQVFTASYQVMVTMVGYSDDDHAVKGTITISNPAPNLAEDVEVSDVISLSGEADVQAVVDCDAADGVQTTLDVPAAVNGTPGEATCSYTADLPDSETRLNTATATLFDVDYEGTKDVEFDLDNPTTEIDECIDIVDDAGTSGVGEDGDDIVLGTVCVDDLDADGKWSDTYTVDIGPFEVCGVYEFTNTVYFETTDDENDTDEDGSGSYTVTVTVPCPGGCTLTYGYWKTHNSIFNDGKHDDPSWDNLMVWVYDEVGDVWNLVPGSESSEFFMSGLSYYEVLQTPVKGNQYFNLAHQYIAAQLNMTDPDGADGSAIATEFATATALLQMYTPDQVAAWKGKVGKEMRAQFVDLAGTLTSYNEGLIGPGHCDEDGTTGFPFLPIPVWRRGKHEEDLEDLRF